MSDMTNAEKKTGEGKTSEIRLDRLPLENLDMKRYIQLDACTRCGECMTWCPVYDQDPSESLIPRRKVIDFLKIAKAQEGFLAKLMREEKLSAPLKTMLSRIFRYKEIGRKEIDDFVMNLYECSTCGQCEVVCPAHIDTVALWEELRRIIVKAGYGPLEPQKALEKSVKAFDNPWQQPRAARSKWARRAKKDGLIQEMPREIRKSKGKVLLFFGCTASYDTNVKQVAVNTINILETLGVDYGVLGAEEKCCGSVLLRMGDPEHKRLFRENIDLFNDLGIETLISSCSGCFKTILQDYPQVAPLDFEVLHTVEFLARLLKKGKLRFKFPVNRTVTYHDPCHLGRATGGFDAPRMIMEAIPGLELIEMPRNREYSRCCGAGGGLKAGFPEIQNKMAQRRIKEAEDTGAEDLVSCCPFCFQGLNVGIAALESQLVMRDISGLVAESLLGYDVFKRAEERAKSPSEPRQETAGAPSPSGRTRDRSERRASRAARREKSEPTSERSANPETPQKSDKAPGARPEGRRRDRSERRAARKRRSDAPNDFTEAVDEPVGKVHAEEAPAQDSGIPSDDRARRRAEKRAARSGRRGSKASAPSEKDPEEHRTDSKGSESREAAAKAFTTEDAQPSSDDKADERARRRAEKRSRRRPG